MKVQKAIKRINEKENFYDINAALDSIFLKNWDYRNGRVVQVNANIDRHRWFEVSTTFVELEDGFIGITGVSYIYSEKMGAIDCNFPCRAFEAIEVPAMTYINKKLVV